MEEEFEFDVAFSFTIDDEALAGELNDFLQSSFKTFIYFDRQNELAARDGEIKFNEVFLKRARLVVILYCDKWGETPFTRIEKEAIRNRAYDNGYDFTIMIPLRGSKPPNWFPRNRLYFNLEKYGVKTLSAIIDSKIQELGGESHPETAKDFALKIKKDNDIKAKISEYNNSFKSVGEGVEEFRILVAEFEKSWFELKKMDIGFGIGEPNINHLNVGGHLEVATNGLKLRFDYNTNYSKEKQLNLMIYEPASIWGDNRDKVIEQKEYYFGLDANLRKGWLDSDSYFNSSQLIDIWIKNILNLAKDSPY